MHKLKDSCRQFLMRTLFTLAIVSALVLSGAGCIPMNVQVSEGTARAPSQHVDVFTRGQVPTRPFKGIARLSAVGKPSDEAKLKKRLIKAAKEVGGEGIIISESETPVEGRYEFKATVVIYE